MCCNHAPNDKTQQTACNEHRCLVVLVTQIMISWLCIRQSQHALVSCCPGLLLLAWVQVLLAIYFLLVGMIVTRQPILWVMPITSTIFASLNSFVGVFASWNSKRVNALSLAHRAWFCSALCQLVFSATASTAALLLLLMQPLALLPHTLPLPEGLVKLLSKSAAAMEPIQSLAAGLIPSVIRSAAGAASDTDVLQQLSTLLACSAAGYYAFRLWLLVRSRSVQYKQRSGQLLALLQYTLLLMVYSVCSYKGSQVRVLAVALVCEAVSAPAAAGELLDLLAAGAGASGRAGGVMRRTLLLSERLAFPLFRYVLYVP